MKEIITFSLMIGAILAKYGGIVHPVPALISMCLFTIAFCVLGILEIRRKEGGK